MSSEKFLDLSPLIDYLPVISTRSRKSRLRYPGKKKKRNPTKVAIIGSGVAGLAAAK